MHWNVYHVLVSCATGWMYCVIPLCHCILRYGEMIGCETKNTKHKKRLLIFPIFNYVYFSFIVFLTYTCLWIAVRSQEWFSSFSVLTAKRVIGFQSYKVKRLRWKHVISFEYVGKLKNICLAFGSPWLTSNFRNLVYVTVFLLCSSKIMHYCNLHAQNYCFDIRVLVFLVVLVWARDRTLRRGIFRHETLRRGTFRRMDTSP